MEELPAPVAEQPVTDDTRNDKEEFEKRLTEAVQARVLALEAEVKAQLEESSAKVIKLYLD